MSNYKDNELLKTLINHYKTNENLRYLSAKDVARRTRELIKAAKSEGILPFDLKVSVRSEYFAGGQAVDIRWKTGAVAKATRFTKVFTLVSREELDDYRFNGRRYDHVTSKYYIVRNEKHEEIEEILNWIVKLWQIDDSDASIDYFCVNYWAHVNYDGGRVDYNLKTLESTVLNSGALDIFIGLYNDDPYNSSLDELVTVSKMLDQDTLIEERR